MRRVPSADDLDKVRGGVEFRNIPMDSIYWPMREAFLAGEEFEFDENNEPVPVENDIFSDEAEQERCEAIGESGPLDVDAGLGVILNEEEAAKEPGSLEEPSESLFEEQKENNDFAHDDDPIDVDFE